VFQNAVVEKESVLLFVADDKGNVEEVIEFNISWTEA
jgi:hypothetical protein